MSNITKSKWKKRKPYIPQVAVVIISYNTSELTRKSLEAVLASKKVQLEVFVVDNASVDRTPVHVARKYKLRKDHDLLKKASQFTHQNKDEYSIWGDVTQDASFVRNIRSSKENGHQVHLVELSENIGFGRANNLACALADYNTEFYTYLNSDAFVEKQTIKKLTQAFKDSTFTKKSAVLRRQRTKLDNVGIVGAQVFNEDQSVQVQGGDLPTLKNIFNWIFFVDDLPFFRHLFGSYQHHEDEMKTLLKHQQAKVGWVGGTVMMAARACLEEIDGFDPLLFMYGEDVELCWRADKKHWDVALIDAGKVIHLGSASSSRKKAIVGEINGLLYLWHKHGSKLDYWVLRQVLRWGIRLRILIFGILRRYGRQRAYEEALALVR